MRSRFIVAVLIAIAAVAACSREPANDVAAVDSAAGAPAAFRCYSAREFFETVSVAMVGAQAHAFSPDGRTLLISSDASGAFNAYELPIDGGEPIRLTNSADNAIFAVSWFPDDRRLLYTYDGGGNELNHIIVRTRAMAS